MSLLGLLGLGDRFAKAKDLADNRIEDQGHKDRQADPKDPFQQGGDSAKKFADPGQPTRRLGRFETRPVELERLLPKKSIMRLNERLILGRRPMLHMRNQTRENG